MELLSKEQVIEVLEKALANPHYLSSSITKGSNYFCSSVLMVLIEDPEILASEAIDIAEHIQNTYIYPSINECLFLKTHLATKGLIPYSTRFNSPVYKAAAHKHWTTLIESLKQEVIRDQKE